MRTRITPRTRSATRLSPKPREQSFARLAVTEGVLLLGLITLLCGLAGAFDDGGDALVLVGVALPLIAIGGTGRVDVPSLAAIGPRPHGCCRDWP